MVTPPILDLILRAATLAPSGDNTQPWTFRLRPDLREVVLEVDPTRDASPMNAGQRMARIAVGAAVENALIQADASGARFVIREIDPITGATTLIWDDLPPQAGGAIVDRLTRRITNRRDFDGRAVPQGTLDRIREDASEVDGVRTVWVVGPDRLANLGEIIGRADGLVFGEAAMRSAFFKNVRFDRAPSAPVEEGLSTGSLELKASERFMLPLLSKMPATLVRILGAASIFADRAKQVVKQSSGLCLTVAPDRSPATDIRVGRAMQRSWLAINAHDLAAQPMMTVMLLDNLLEFGELDLIAAIGRSKMESVLDDFRAAIPEMGDGRPAFLCRFGHAPAPTSRTARLSWQDRARTSPAGQSAAAAI